MWGWTLIGARRLRQDMARLLLLSRQERRTSVVVSSDASERPTLAALMFQKRILHLLTRRVICRRSKVPASGLSSPPLRSMASASPFGPHSRFAGDKPAFTYGTAWKKDQTKVLVKQALAQGFRRVDTAAQPKHYQEHLVGEALRDAYTEGLPRAHLHVQTKFTTPAGQDLANMPYDPAAPLDTQIHTSITSSLHNLRTHEESPEDAYLDCVLLHSPLPTLDQTLAAWRLLETYVPHRIKSLGISNVALPVVRAIYAAATVKPSVVQNRFYAQTRYDSALRAFCREHHIAYQSFWTLTGNPKLLKSKPVLELAGKAEVGVPTALYALVMELGVEVLNGTTSVEHMREDLDGVEKVSKWARENVTEWRRLVRDFASLTEVEF